ncbi:MAG TPA: ABC transporter permease [Thermoplasmata archaeon]|nr:ABC transporter permease [Thermoplasmata archaeon]
MRGARRPRPLRHLQFQTALALTAVEVAVALPVVLLSVGGGVSQHEITALEQTGFQVVVGAPGLHGIVGTHALSAQIGGVAHVRASSPLLSVPVTAYVPGGGEAPVLAEGVLPGPFLATTSPQEVGLFPKPLPLGDPLDSVHFANGSYTGPATYSVIVSSPLATARSLSVGEPILLSAAGNRSQATQFNVTGSFGVPPSLLGPNGAFVVIVPLSDLQLLTGNAKGTNGQLLDASDTIEVALAGSAATSDAAVSSAASSIQALAPYYSVSTLSEQVAALDSAQSVLTGFYLGLSSFSLAIGIVFLGVLLVRRVEAMRSSIALRRAIGLPSRSLLAEFARVAVLLGAGGSALGILLGYVVVDFLGTFGSTSVASVARLAVFDPGELALLAAGVVGLSALLSLVATRAALRLSIAGALR